MSLPSLNFESATRTEVGKIRRLNEDACLAHPSAGLWTVADGMGGHSAGDLASQMIVNALQKIKPQQQLSELVDFVEHSILGVNDRLYELGEAQNQTSGSTIVVLLAIGHHCAFMWAGDSRLYRFRDDQLTQLTTDHTQAETYIEQGLIERDQARDHPSGNMVTRAVGASKELFLDIDMASLLSGDRYILCSDGLDKHVMDNEIAAEVSHGKPNEVVDRLIDLTLERGASDNVTICVVDVQ